MCFQPLTTKDAFKGKHRFSAPINFSAEEHHGGAAAAHGPWRGEMRAQIPLRGCARREKADVDARDGLGAGVQRRIFVAPHLPTQSPSQFPPTKHSQLRREELARNPCTAPPLPLWFCARHGGMQSDGPGWFSAVSRAQPWPLRAWLAERFRTGESMCSV